MFGLLLLLALWEGLEPRQSADAYPARAAAGAVTVGAEYQGRGITVKSSSWLVGDYLAVEVGLFPGSGRNMDVKAGSIMLRINDETAPRKPAAASAVGASLRSTALNAGRGIEASAGTSSGGIIFGRPRRTEEQFPGDPTVRRPRPTQDPVGRPVEEQPGLTEAQAVVEYALPEGEVKGPVAGFVYYYFPGKKKIRKLELVYEGKSLPLL